MLTVQGYSGNASDSFSAHNTFAFSSYDRDNDRAPDCCPCAPAYGGGWWFFRWIKLIALANYSMRDSKRLMSIFLYAWPKFFQSHRIVNNLSQLLRVELERGVPLRTRGQRLLPRYNLGAVEGWLLPQSDEDECQARHGCFCWCQVDVTARLMLRPLANVWHEIATCY